MPSPCVKECKVNGDKVCGGCKRTLEEIANWTKMSPLHQAQIIKRIKQDGA